MKFSALYQKYQKMEQPTFTLSVDGTKLERGRTVSVQRLSCELTCQPEAGYLLLEACMDPKEPLGKSWMKAFKAGAEGVLSLGYGGKETEVFCGMLYEVTWDDPLDDGVLGLRAVFLDVRGRLMTASCSDAGSARTMSQMVQTILSQDFCKKLAPKQKIEAVPKDWDLPAQRNGLSDYDVLCKTAKFLCYEWYACGKELYFGPPRPESSPIVTFDGTTGLLEIRRTRSLVKQSAAVVVSGTDDQGERILARENRKKDSGFGAEGMQSALSNLLHTPEPTLRTMAQAKYLAKARMEAQQHSAGGIEGRCLGTPELRPGRFMEAESLSEPVNGTYYLQTVRHELTVGGYSTYFKGED